MCVLTAVPKSSPRINSVASVARSLGRTPQPSPTTAAFDKVEPKSYTPKHLAEKILNTRGSLEGERKLVTVLFADVAGYTSLSEKLDPEDVHKIMEGCLHILMEEVHKYEGTINQFTGDGVMALFGAPLAHEDHARRACYAALAVQKDLAGYGRKVDSGLADRQLSEGFLNARQVREVLAK